MSRRTPIAFALGFAALLLPVAAAAEIYEWVDAQGRHHYTQKLSDVPAGQRADARAGATKRPQLNGASPAEAQQPSRNSSANERPKLECNGGVCARPGVLSIGRPSPAKASEERIGPWTERSFRQTFQQYQTRIRMLESTIASLEASGADRNPGHRRDNVSRRNYDRYLTRHGSYENAKRDLETARKQLANFREKARRAGVPPGWMR